MVRVEALFGAVCFELPVARLCGTYLSPVTLKVLPLRLDTGEQAGYDRSRELFLSHFRPFAEAHPEASWQDFVRAASRSPAGREALDALRRSRAIISLPRAK